jgi:hypothetical protein
MAGLHVLENNFFCVLPIFNLEKGSTLNKQCLLSCFILFTLFLSGCKAASQLPATPASTPIPSAVPTIVPTSVPTPTLTPTVLITPKITATPIVAMINTDDDLKRLVKQIYPMPCIAYNFAKAPLSDVNHASKLNFIEVNIQPDPKHYWVSEIADNADGSCQAFVACRPEFCQDKIYVQDDETRKVYEIDWEARMPWRPIQWVTWINNDTFTFLQSSNPDQALMIVINFDKREVLYEAIIFPDNFCR